jgi:hypothetical protein
MLTGAAKCLEIVPFTPLAHIVRMPAQRLTLIID